MSHSQKYIEELDKQFQSGHAKEHAYRPALKTFLESLLEGVLAINEPKQQKWGSPDYVVTKKRKSEAIPVGYIEAKDIDVNLDKIEDTEQLKRYNEGFDNLILTNYREFRFFKYGEKVISISIAEIDDFHAQKKSIKANPDNFGQLEALLLNFVGFMGQTLKSPKELAQKMANKAQMMRGVFKKALDDKESPSQSLAEQHKAFQQILIHDMDTAQFADVYAQTIAYGLFTARLHDTTLEDFSRNEARDLIPKSNPFLRKLFDYVCGADLEEGVKWIVDELCEVYRAADIKAILAGFGKQSGRNQIAQGARGLVHARTRG
ncbi:MAG: adenine-specific DNA methyltransferase [Hyphomonadaceae bacterium]|nr:MAG: adenine-specific DNA methyltransferase [Hyphomonadaceae bacterium]